MGKKITDEVKAEMQGSDRIQDGSFAREWIWKTSAQRPHFNAMRRLRKSI